MTGTGPAGTIAAIGQFTRLLVQPSYDKSALHRLLKGEEQADDLLTNYAQDESLTDLDLALLRPLRRLNFLDLGESSH